MTVPESRELTERERLLIERLVMRGSIVPTRYIEQLPRVTVVARCDCGCPSIDLAVDGRTVRAGSGSTILCEARGVSPEGVTFGIILHGREELLSELEVFPIGDAAVFTLPDVERIDFFDGA